MRMFNERKLRARRDWQHAMKAKSEAGMGAMVHEMEESFKKSPKLYGSILIGIALTMILPLMAMSSVLLEGDEARQRIKRSECCERACVYVISKEDVCYARVYHSLFNRTILRLQSLK